MDVALSMLVLAAVALVAGAVYLWRRPGGRRRAILMLVLAGVFAINVAIWSIPGPGGTAPLALASGEAPR